MVQHHVGIDSHKHAQDIYTKTPNYGTPNLREI